MESKSGILVGILTFLGALEIICLLLYFAGNITVFTQDLFIFLQVIIAAMAGMFILCLLAGRSSYDN